MVEHFPKSLASGEKPDATEVRYQFYKTNSFPHFFLLQRNIYSAAVEKCNVVGFPRMRVFGGKTFNESHPACTFCF